MTEHNMRILRVTWQRHRLLHDLAHNDLAQGDLAEAGNIWMSVFMYACMYVHVCVYLKFIPWMFLSEPTTEAIHPT